MKIFLCIIFAGLLCSGCERHSSEETAALHEEHGHHKKAGAEEHRVEKNIETTDTKPSEN